MKIGWIADRGIECGGAELTSNYLVQNAPGWADVIHCPAGQRPSTVDLFVAQNCTEYDARWIEPLSRVPVIRHLHDMWPVGDPLLRRWILDNAALLIFASLPHREAFPYPTSVPVSMIPEAVDVELFRQAARNAEERRGCVWANHPYPHKGLGHAIDWALRTGNSLDVYGPERSTSVGTVRFLGALPYSAMPETLARYEKLVFFPTGRAGVDPCPRIVIEGWAAGCELVVNDRAGTTWWLKHEPRALEQAVDMFWGVVKKTYDAQHA
jgi:hypothetical protein